MKRRFYVLALSLTTLVASAWIIARTVYATSVITVTCRNGTTKQCSGASCTGSDYNSIGGNGWCQCTNPTPGGPADVKDCDNVSADGPAPESTPVN